MQICFNNLFNALTERLSNKIYYKFKIKKIVQIIIEINKNINKNIKAQFNNLEVIRFCYRQEVADVIFYISLFFKIRYNSKHIFLLLKSEDKTFLRLYRNYTLSNKLLEC
jgi:hypothetical protein